MTTLPRPDVDPDGLLEYSVVYTDRALNHMSTRFIGVMQDLIGVLAEAYGADGVAIVPGGGTFAMEAVARQLATGRRCLVIRNGFFSFRWSQILEMGAIAESVEVLAARPESEAVDAAWAPVPVEEVVARIEAERPEVVFAPHVETASGMMLPPDYLRAVAEAVHAGGGLFVLDCIASGAEWVDLTESGVDVLISAPQKGWSGSPCAGFVMLSPAGRAAVEASVSTSFAADLKKWLGLADGYREGRAAYHATMPTDALAVNARVMLEARERGLGELRTLQRALGRRVRDLLAERGYPSVAASGFEAPGVVVAHTTDPDLASTAAFARVGVQAAAGVPLMCGEPEGYRAFRLGLFGLDKLDDIEGTVQRLADALDAVEAACG